MTSLSGTLLHLDQINDTRTRILSQQEELGRYLADISALYSALQAGLRVSDAVSHSVLQLELSALPRNVSDVERYVRVEISSCLPSLLKYAGDTHVVKINSSQDSVSLSLQLPCTCSLALLSVSIHLMYSCPRSIKHLLPHNKQTFSSNIWDKTIKTETRPGTSFSSGSLHHIIEEYLDNRDPGREGRNYCLTFKCEQGLVPDKIAGCCVRPGSGSGIEPCGTPEHQIRDLPALSILEAVVAVRGIASCSGVGCSVAESVSLSSTVGSLMTSYFDLRGIT